MCRAEVPLWSSLVFWSWWWFCYCFEGCNRNLKGLIFSTAHCAGHFGSLDRSCCSRTRSESSVSLCWSLAKPLHLFFSSTCNKPPATDPMQREVTNENCKHQEIRLMLKYVPNDITFWVLLGEKFMFFVSPRLAKIHTACSHSQHLLLLTSLTCFIWIQWVIWTCPLTSWLPMYAES